MRVARSASQERAFEYREVGWCVWITAIDRKLDSVAAAPVPLFSGSVLSVNGRDNPVPLFSGSVLSVDGRDNRCQAADTRPPPPARTGAPPVQLQ
ncbi:hypothetical protein SprV_0802479400 [Sparganum proliferum]